MDNTEDITNCLEFVYNSNYVLLDIFSTNLIDIIFNSDTYVLDKNTINVDDRAKYLLLDDLRELEGESNIYDTPFLVYHSTVTWN